MMEILNEIDEDDNQTISKEEFETLKNSSEIAKVFDLLEVDKKHIIALADALLKKIKNIKNRPSKILQNWQK